MDMDLIKSSALHSMGKLNEAEKIIEEAIEIGEKDGDSLIICDLYLNYATILLH